MRPPCPPPLTAPSAATSHRLGRRRPASRPSTAGSPRIAPSHGLSAATACAARRATPASAATCASTAQHGRSFIVMDAPPPQEDVRPFVAWPRMLRACRTATRRACSSADAERGLPAARATSARTLYLQALQEAVARDDLRARRRADARRDRRAACSGSRAPTRARCRPTTTRCCGANSRCFPTGAWRANAASPGRPTQQAHWQAACDAAGGQRARASRSSRCTATTCRAT